MENPAAANTSAKLDKKNKSKLHGGSSDQEAFLRDVKPRRSFWRNLFKKQPKKTEVPEMVTTDQKTALLSSRLNAIFEEPKTPEEKDHVVEEIEEIKKTLKKVAPQPTSVLLSGITGGAESPVCPVQDEGLLDYMSDESSSSSGASEAEAETEQQTPCAVNRTRDSLDEFITQLSVAEAGDPRRVAETYSFEYSEASESSTDGAERADKVKFDEKVEQKDADSNIVVKDLNPGEDEQSPPQPVEEQQVVAAAAAEDVKPAPPASKIPIAIPMPTPVAEQPNINKPLQTKRSTTSAHHANKTATPSRESLEVEKSVDENSVREHEEEEDEEEELWSKKLNELSGLSKSMLPATVDVNSLDESETGCREYRLDEFFKMVFRQTADTRVLNYSVAYDPVLANFSVQCRQPPVRIDDKQKVVRKRKMMALQHDKTQMAACLKEIEQQQELLHNNNNNNNNNNNVPQNSPSLTKNNHDNILFVLENTKDKLQKYLEDNNSTFDPKILNLYPDNYLDIYNLDSFPLHSSSSSSSSSKSKSQTLVPNKMKQFHHVEQDIDNIFAELLVNVAELKETCILNGAACDDQDQDQEPLITARPAPAQATASAVLDDILDRVFDESKVEKSKKFGPYYDRKPGDEKVTCKLDVYKKLRTTDPPEVTDSLKHIFFGENSGEVIQSEFNLIDENSPKPGPSKNLKSASQNTLNTTLAHLPSVPSTDLYLSHGSSLKFENENITTLMENRCSGLTGSSLQAEFAPDVVTAFGGNASVSGGGSGHKEHLQLERKAPETNLHPMEEEATLVKEEIEKSIADNLKTFQESMVKINRMNQKTVEMLASSTFSTPEGSLSILSTITENLLEPTGSTSSAERYPQFIPRPDKPS